MPEALVFGETGETAGWEKTAHFNKEVWGEHRGATSPAHRWAEVLAFTCTDRRGKSRGSELAAKCRAGGSLPCWHQELEP